jgi:hypothetical protein
MAQIADSRFKQGLLKIGQWFLYLYIIKGAMQGLMG